MVLKAALIGFMCWFSAADNGSPLGIQFHLLFQNPVVGGWIVGLILGKPVEGLLIGAAIQAMYLGNVVIGGVATADMPYVAYPSIALALLANADANVAITIAATVGVLGAAVFTMYTGVASIFYAMGDRAIDKGDIKGMKRAYRVYPAIFTFLLRGGLTFLIVMLGATYAQSVLAGIPPVVLHIAGVLGGLLPAVGMAILLTYTLKDIKMIIFFVMGVMAVTLLGFNTVSVAVLGVCLAIMYYMFTHNQTAKSEEVL
jgi:PTS system mannose-specific IIC component